jgi:hypothetical protein
MVPEVLKQINLQDVSSRGPVNSQEVIEPGRIFKIVQQPEPFR